MLHQLHLGSLQVTILSNHPDCNDCTSIITYGTDGVRSCCDPTIEYTLSDDISIGPTLSTSIGATIGDGFMSSLWLTTPGPNQTVGHLITIYMGSDC